MANENEGTFKPRGDGDMDRLAAAFHEQGSTPTPEVERVLKALEAKRAEETPEETTEESPEEISAAPEEEEVEAAVEGADAEVEVETTDDEEPEASDDEMVDMGDGTQVPLKELTSGYLRQSDYTRKTQELAEQRKAFEADKQKYIEQSAQVGSYVNHLVEQLEANIKNDTLTEAQLEELRTSDPGEYAARRADEQRKQELVNAAKAQQQALYNQQRYEIVTRERAALAQSNPAFAQNFDDTYAELTAWVTSPEGGGLPPEMWDQVFDHRAVTLAHKAMMHDRAAKVEAPKVARKLAKLPKVVRPGRKVDTGQARSNEYEQTLSRAKETGRLDDLAAAFAQKERIRRGR